MTAKKPVCKTGVAWPCDSGKQGQAGGQELGGCLMADPVLA